MYHRGESEHAQTNIRLDQFDAHLAELSKTSTTSYPARNSKGHKIRRALPAFTVAITIDDAFNPVFAEAAHGLNRGFHLRFCLHARSARSLAMKWDQIRKLTEDGATIGHQTHSHLHMARSGRDAVLSDIKANERFQKGSASCRNCLRTMVKLISQQWRRSRKWDQFAFGQHSGVVHRTSEPYFLTLSQRG